MTGVDLTRCQRRVLETLVAEAETTAGPVAAEELGEEIGRTPGAIRNTMQVLRSLQLVEGVPGPSGGYSPTAAAYRAVGCEGGEDTSVPIDIAGRSLRETSASVVSFSTVDETDRSRVEVQLTGTVPDLDGGESITVGPIPTTGMVLDGTVIGLDETEPTLVCAVDSVGVVEAT
jgi:predicted transcriptional regulator